MVSQATKKALTAEDAEDAEEKRKEKYVSEAKTCHPI